MGLTVPTKNQHQRRQFHGFIPSHMINRSRDAIFRKYKNRHINRLGAGERCYQNRVLNIFWILFWSKLIKSCYGKKTTRAIYIMFSQKMQTCSVKSGYLPDILVNLKKNVEEASFPQQDPCSLSKLLTFYRIV